MALSPGSRLGAYEIGEAIGSGGMGEVYRAHDPRLGRAVAIKILPAGAAADVERRARFEREAKAIAALNHPNIVTIHAVEDSNGVPFFTMEYIEGRTLGQIIPARGLPLEELLHIAIPLTDAVGAAHQRGILHRDLKPANVMVTAEGRVKVLDFGLAKLREAVLQADGGTQPTAEATGEGRILGTVAYMSPEQAEGKPVDQRSDVFSLGILLYEMATGQQPFKGDTSVSVISAILKDAPGSVSDLRPDLPRDLGKILKRALNKDPEHRYQTAKDLRNDLETLKEELDSGEILRTGSRPAGTQRMRRPWLVTTALLAVVGLVATGTWLVSRVLRPPPEAPQAQLFFDDFTLTRFPVEEASEHAVAVSPDGQYVAYVSIEDGRQGLRVRQAEPSATATVRVVPPADVQYYDVSFSPDGNRLYYVAYLQEQRAATLYEVSVLGGAPRRLIYDVDRGISFSPDAARVAFVRNVPGEGGSIMIANADGTGLRALVTRQIPNEFVLANVAWSGDGRTIAAAAWDGLRAAIVMINATTGAMEAVGEKRWNDVTSIAWSRKEPHLIIAATDPSVADTRQLWEVSLPAGTVRRITKDIGSYGRVSLTADATTIVAVRSESRGTLWVGPSAQPDRVARIASVPDTVRSGQGVGPVRWTPDGHILYIANVSGNDDIWAVRPDGSDLQQLTTSPGFDGFPTVAPDGRYIAFLSARDGHQSVWRMDPDGGRQTKLTDGVIDASPVVAADGRSIYFVQNDGPGQPLCAVPIEGGQPALLSGPPSLAPAAPWHGVPAGFLPHDISPDGSLIVGDYFDHQTNRTRVVVIPARGQTAVHNLDIPLPFGAGRTYAWAPEGDAITFVKTTEGVANLWRQPLDGASATRLTHFTAGDDILVHAWSRDGKLLALVRAATERRVVMMRDVGRRR